MDTAPSTNAIPAPPDIGRRVEVVRVGEERAPVVVIDDVARAPEALVDAASGQTFTAMGDHYPGVRAPASPQVLAEIDEVLGWALYEVFGFREGARVRESAFSIVTTPPGELSVFQRLPHFDSVDPRRLAVLLYLSRPEQGGTAFYRHNETGFEEVNAARFATFKAALEADTARRGLPPAAYPGERVHGFTRTATLPAAFNRALLYRGNSLHSGAIPHDLALDSDPRVGRLTLNVFLEPRA